MRAPPPRSRAWRESPWSQRPRRPARGVIAPTIGSAASKSTSPTSLPAASSQLMPTSMIVWPPRTASAPIVRARPTAATTISAARHSAAKSRVCVWHVVTVALRAVSMAATGRPITSDRPTTATFCPIQLNTVMVQQRQHGLGRAGSKALATTRKRGEQRGRCHGVNILGGIECRGNRILVKPSGQRTKTSGSHEQRGRH